MIDRPSKFPDWAVIDAVDPVENTPNVLEPPDAEKQIGWVPHAVVPNNYLNWIHRTTNDWLKYLDSKVTTPVALKAKRPNAKTAGAGAIIYLPDIGKGGTMAFSDGTKWRKISDNSIITE